MAKSPSCPPVEGINGHTQEDIELDVYAYLQSKMDEYEIDLELVDVVVSGSRCRGWKKQILTSMWSWSTREKEEALCKAYGECELPFVEMGQYGRWIDIGEFAAIQQSDRLAFSVEFNDETDEITIFDGENFEYKGLRETVYPDQAEKKAVIEQRDKAGKEVPEKITKKKSEREI